MVLRAFRIALDILIQHHFHPRQPVGRFFPTGEMQRWQDEQVGRHECRRGIAGQAEDEFGDGVAGGVLERHGGERAGFPRLHGNAAEVDGAAEGALDGRFQEVQLAHGDAARGHDDVHGAESAAEMLFERAGSGDVGGGDWKVWGGVTYLSLAMPKSST